MTDIHLETRCSPDVGQGFYGVFDGGSEDNDE